ncbi:uncharacterized protein LOC144621336 [Crassostrea virginica]
MGILFHRFNLRSTYSTNIKEPESGFRHKLSEVTITFCTMLKITMSRSFAFAVLMAACVLMVSMATTTTTTEVPSNSTTTPKPTLIPCSFAFVLRMFPRLECASFFRNQTGNVA